MNECGLSAEAVAVFFPLPRLVNLYFVRRHFKRARTAALAKQASEIRNAGFDQSRMKAEGLARYGERVVAIAAA